MIVETRKKDKLAQGQTIKEGQVKAQSWKCLYLREYKQKKQIKHKNKVLNQDSIHVRMEEDYFSRKGVYQ